MFSDLDNDRIIENKDHKSIYSVPLSFYNQGIHNVIFIKCEGEEEGDLYNFSPISNKHKK